MGVIATFMTIVLALPMCRSKYVREYSNFEFDVHQILQRTAFLEAGLSECTRKTEYLGQSQRRQENEIQLQASKMQKLESRVIMMKENESKVKKLENKLNEALEIINKLKKEVEIAKLQGKSDNTTLTQFQALENYEEYMQNQSLDHTSSWENLDQIIDNRTISGRISTSSRIKRTSGLGKTNIAFAVTMAGWKEITLTGHELLPFNVELLNDGNGFDSHLKSFICPVTGIYFFTATITSNNHKFEASIVIDGDEKVSISTDGSPNLQQGSSSIVAHCSKGQRVYVCIHNPDYAIGFLSEKFSVFSGFLITEMESVSS